MSYAIQFIGPQTVLSCIMIIIRFGVTLCFLDSKHPGHLFQNSALLSFQHQYTGLNFTFHNTEGPYVKDGA